MGATDSVSRREALVVLGGAVLAGCGFVGTGEVDLSGMEEAVIAASARVIGFGVPSERIVNGIGHALFMGPDVDTSARLTADELDVIVQAAWEHVPWEPNAIRIAARDAATGETAVDLVTAAAGLAPMRSGPFGDEGVALTSMAARYGEWTEPE